MYGSLMKMYRDYVEYIPIALIALLSAADAEIDHKTTSITYQVAITVITAVIFYILVTKYNATKQVAFFISSFLWIAFVYVKRSFLIQQ